MPRSPLRRWLAAGVFSCGLALSAAHAAVLPAGFVLDDVTPTVGSWDTPVAVAYLPDGRMLVAEKPGRVWACTNGIRPAQAMWDGTAEVENSFDRGLLGMAVDPAWNLNHYVYLSYSVDPDSNGVDDDGAVFSRLVRYQVSFDDSTTFDPESRTVLVGTSWADAPLSLSQSHGVGALRFGRDGMLFAGYGDGGHFEYMDAGGHDPAAFGPGLADPALDVGAFRAQLLNNLNGKILRIDPATGRGLPSNPWWDGNPNSARSRVWAYGVRNPYRFCLRPGTGHPNPAAADPGMILLGDPGWTSWEEVNVIDGGGHDFGWPCEEGLLPTTQYSTAPPEARWPCDSLGGWLSPASSLSKPILSISHNIASQSTPPGLLGNCAIGGQFYTGSLYPVEYAGRYFTADFGLGWMKTAQIDSAGALVSLENFAEGLPGPVDIEVEPKTGDIVFVSIYFNRIYRIRFESAGTNAAPVARAAAIPTAGIAPLTVQFTDAGTTDVNGDTLAYSWDFGDFSGSPLASPSHTYVLPGAYRAVLAADDGHGGVGRDTLLITVAATALFPTTAVLDSFNRASTGGLGSNWGDDTTGISLFRGRIVQPSQPWSDAVWMPEMFGPDQEAYFTLSRINTETTDYALMLKVQGATWENGFLEVRYAAAAGSILLDTYDPQAGWHTWLTLPGESLQRRDQLGARVYAGGLVEIYLNGASIGSADVSGWAYASAGGHIGLSMAQAMSSSLDNFGGGNAVLGLNTAPFVHASLPDTSWGVTGDTISLACVAIDAQQPAATLAYRWDVDLHHNNHVHPSVYSTTDSAGAFVMADHDDGTGVYYLARVSVTDDGLLVRADSACVFPEIDEAPCAPIFDPPVQVDGQPTNLTFRLSNRGHMPAQRARWRVVVDDATAAEGDTLVPARSGVPLTVTLGTLDPGPHVLRIVADTLQAIVETNEANNALTLTFNVLHGTLGPGEQMPHVLALSAPWPNPAAGRASLSLELPSPSVVEWAVHDVQGRAVWREAVRPYGAGHWTLAWDGRTRAGSPAPAGVYLVRVRVGDKEFTRRVVRVR